MLYLELARKASSAKEYAGMNKKGTQKQ